MFETFLVTFRESLEAALIVGIVMAFLKRNHKTSSYPLVLTAIAAALGFSFFGAYGFSFIEGGFTGVNEQIFEGTVMWIAAGLLTYMIVWLYRQKNMRHKLEQKLMEHAETIKKMSLFSLVFFAVFREGIETVLFMNAIRFSAGHVALWGVFLGFLAAVVTGYMLFVLEVKLPMKRFFQFSGALLILFAAGLFAHGFHEFEEAGLVPMIVEHLYDINFLLDEESYLGEVMKGIFGYNANPSLGEFTIYLTYLLGAFALFFRPKRETLTHLPRNE
jgi:high-affinity iron transporter